MLGDNEPSHFLAHLGSAYVEMPSGRHSGRREIDCRARENLASLQWVCRLNFPPMFDSSTVAARLRR